MIIIGIDPGTRITGYGLIETVSSRSLQLLDYGCIRPKAQDNLSDRYHAIFSATGALIDRYHPDALAVETQYVQKNPQSALKLGMARGVIIVAARERGVPVFEYSPSKAKLAVVGNGRASKQQVQGMVKMLLNMSTLPTPEDAADALALAICHHQATQNKTFCSQEI